MEKITDLSFSNLVNLIQHDEKIAGDILNNLAFELEDIRNQIKEHEECLNRLKSVEKMIINGSKNILQHINKKTPLVVIKNNYLVIVTDTNLIIEKNTI